MIPTCCPNLLLSLYEGMAPCLDKYQLYRDILYQKLVNLGENTVSPRADKRLLPIAIEKFPDDQSNDCNQL